MSYSIKTDIDGNKYADVDSRIKKITDELGGGVYYNPSSEKSSVKSSITTSTENVNKFPLKDVKSKIEKDKLPSAKLIAVVRSKPLGKMSSINSIPTSTENVNRFYVKDEKYFELAKNPKL